MHYTFWEMLGRRGAVSPHHRRIQAKASCFLEHGGSRIVRTMGLEAILLIIFQDPSVLKQSLNTSSALSPEQMPDEDCSDKVELSK